MRKHKVTIRALAKQMQITMKRVRKLREKGLRGPAIRDWMEHITGKDSGPIPSRYRIRHHTEEAICGHCGCPLYVGDFAFEHAGEAFCSSRCFRVFGPTHAS